ncbi:TIGR02444 family protein [Pseudomonas sp. UL073]|uniref:TIGR02444 family protein n=1 Tax=Zestomonas insulae TaxID=2809017 RepID=A0ABS2IJL5_9GAMM|nr:TIGR02444 family protein [Pseudomonas insulae]MBM7063252.1 TIGR02444 family protein [Pseudomonas insulae]
MPSDLWSFAIHFYERDGVESACLQLQEAGADVCLLLAGAWLSQREVACSPARAEQLQEIAEPWQRTVIAPLRATRQAWRAASESDAGLHGLREQLKALELAAERQLLLQLESTTQPWPSDAASGTDDWLKVLAGAAGEQQCAALQTLRGALGLA